MVLNQCSNNMLPESRAGVGNFSLHEIRFQKSFFILSEKESFFKIFFRKKIKDSFLKIFFRSIEKDSFFGNLFSKTEKRFFFQKSVFVKRKELQEILFSDSKFFHHIKVKKSCLMKTKLSQMPPRNH